MTRKIRIYQHGRNTSGRLSSRYRVFIAEDGQTNVRYFRTLKKAREYLRGKRGAFVIVHRTRANMRWGYTETVARWGGDAWLNFDTLRLFDEKKHARGSLKLPAHCY